MISPFLYRTTITALEAHLPFTLAHFCTRDDFTKALQKNCTRSPFIFALVELLFRPRVLPKLLASSSAMCVCLSATDVCIYTRPRFEFLPRHCYLEISLAPRCHGNSAEPLKDTYIYIYICLYSQCVGLFAVVPKTGRKKGKKGAQKGWSGKWLRSRTLLMFVQVPGTWHRRVICGEFTGESWRRINGHPETSHSPTAAGRVH